MATDETAGLSTEFSKSSIVESPVKDEEEKSDAADADANSKPVVDKEKAEEFKELGNQAFRGTKIKFKGKLDILCLATTHTVSENILFGEK